MPTETSVTALVGQVLRLNGRALEGVTLRIDDRTARTDSKGRFLLTSISSGHHKLLIDGRTANRRGHTYGVFEVWVDLTERKTNVLPYTIWMPKIDTAHAVTIPSPTTDEVVLTTPHIPGLEVRIPPGTVITDVEGQVVTEISITPIPVDRPPFPMPPVEFPIYFTIQPGGAYISPTGIRVIYPNYTNEPPGTRINYWYYDLEDEEAWYPYGQGTVSPDGKKIIPDPDVILYAFTGVSFNTGQTPPDNGPPPGSGVVEGDPVDLSTGLFVLRKTDLFLQDILPIELTRTYRPEDSQSRAFGVGATHPYEIFPKAVRLFEDVDLIMPDGGRVKYVRISGEGFDSVLEHASTPTMFYKSRVKFDSNRSLWNLTLKEGTVYEFALFAPLQSIHDRYGNKITLLRTDANGAPDPRGNISQIRSPNGRWIEFTYDASNRITQAKDNIGRVVSYAYDASDRLSKVTDPKGGVTEYTYDTSHRMLTLKDARGIIFLRNDYDSSGRVIRQTQADGSTYQFAYTVDGNGKITQTLVTDPRGNIRRVTFNTSGYVLTDTRALGRAEEQTTVYERESGTNLVLSVTDPLGRKTAYTYDAMGNVTSITRLVGTLEAVTASFTYESKFNQLTSFTDPLGHTTTFTRDDKGNLTSVTDPLGNRTTLAYNESGQPTSVTDALNNTTQLIYELGDLIALIDPLGRRTTRSIDTAGRLVSLTNPLAQTTRYEYDVMNQVIQVTDQSGGVTAFTFDPNGNVLSVTDARGGVTRYTYDEMDRLVSRTDPLGRSESYEYDAAGNRTQFTDRKGQVTNRSYDALNRRAGVTHADGSTTIYTYDVGNRLTQVADSVSGVITLTYDNLDRLTELSTPQGTTTYTYDAAGRRTSMTVQGQPPVTYNYDDVRRLTEITQGVAAVTIDYDAAGRPTSRALPGNVVVEFGYDAASQPTSITYKRAGSILGDLIYEYDAAGNRTKIGGSFARTVTPEAIVRLTYDAANRLVQQETTVLTYDANGNLTSDGRRTYTWDVRNQLASITGRGLPASFDYDAFGRRIRKVINGTATEFLFDRLNVLQERSGGTPVANLLTGLGIDEYFMRTDADGTHILLRDCLGSTLGLLDANGVFRTEYTYEPFGMTTAAGTASTNPFQYTGRENDATGLYYYRARYYSPSLRRFIGEDPIGFGGGDINLYAYALDSPTNLTDPLGLTHEPGDLIEKVAEYYEWYEKYDKAHEYWNLLQEIRERGEQTETIGRKDPVEGVKHATEDLLRTYRDLYKSAVSMSPYFPSWFFKPLE